MFFFYICVAAGRSVTSFLWSLSSRPSLCFCSLCCNLYCITTLVYPLIVNLSCVIPYLYVYLPYYIICLFVTTFLSLNKVAVYIYIYIKLIVITNMSNFNQRFYIYFIFIYLFTFLAKLSIITNVCHERELIL